MILDSFPSPTLSFGEAERELRERLRDWIAANDPGEVPEDYEERLRSGVRWQAALNDAGFIGLSWPREYGGHGLGLAAEAVLAEQMATSAST
jgi:alkylation response protein AidB-like acyl-CoA dehydrogenase